MTTLVENFPGWPEGIQGPELIDNMKKQAARFGATFQLAHLVSVDLKQNPYPPADLGGGDSDPHADHRLGSQRALAGFAERTGADRPRRFELRHVRRLLLPRASEIAVVGGGDSAMEEALFLTRFASKVTLLHRRSAFRASKIMLERVMAHPQIVLRPNTVIEEVLVLRRRMAVAE